MRIIVLRSTDAGRMSELITIVGNDTKVDEICILGKLVGMVLAHLLE